MPPIESKTETEESSGKGRKQAIAIALSMKRKAEGKSEGGKVGNCYACGGQVNPKLDAANMYQGGGVDESYDPESINDTDGDSDDLVYSPEKFGESGFGAADNEESDDDKRNKFLSGYMISRRLRGQG